MPNQKLNVRDRLEDDQLDLSMSDLDEVPVRDIAQIKKATHLDLSNNRLTSLGKNFATLTHIVKLDLSKNHLTGLPDNFGDLVYLKHLDLYSNKITHLPLSLGQLKSLRWLDLKNNPLVPALVDIVGPCLDAQQCQQSARRVVAFLQKMQEQVEEERQRRQQQKKKQQEMLELAAQEKKKNEQQQKKKKKASKSNDKSQSKPENGVKMLIPSPGGDNVNAIKKDKPNLSGKQKKVSGKKSSGILGKLMKFAFYTSLLIGLPLLALFSLDKEHFALVQETLSNISNATVAVLPEPLVEKGQQLLVALRPLTTAITDNICSLSHEAYLKGEATYMWLRTDTTVQQYLDGLRSTWDVLCVKIGETYRTISQQVPIYIGIVKKKLF